METVRLRLVGHQRGEHRRETDRLRTEIPAYRRAVPRVEDEIDRRENGAQPVGEKVRRWDAQRNPRIPDLPLRAHEPLRERRLGNEETAGDLRRRETADEAQRQRDLRVRGERRMAAGEDQLEAFVGDGLLRGLGKLFGAGEQLGLARERLVAPDAVYRAVARGRDDPRTGIRRHAVQRPPLRSANERVLNRVLGEVEITEDAAEDRDRLRPLIAVRTREVVYAETSAGIITTGRTSMCP